MRARPHGYGSSFCLSLVIERLILLNIIITIGIRITLKILLPLSNIYFYPLSSAVNCKLESCPTTTSTARSSTAPPSLPSTPHHCPTQNLNYLRNSPSQLPTILLPSSFPSPISETAKDAPPHSNISSPPPPTPNASS